MKYLVIYFTLLAANAANSVYAHHPTDSNSLNNKLKFNSFRYFDIVEKKLPDISAALYNNTLLIYQPSLKENDTISFTAMDLKENKTKVLSVYVPGISFKIRNPRATRIAFSGKYVVVMFFEQILILSFVNENALLYQDIVPFNERIGYLGVEGDNVILAKAYNFHPYDQSTKTFIGTYNILTKTVSNPTHPQINNIEYSHFIPNEIFSFNDKCVAFSQYDSYKIDILNSDFSLKSTIRDSLRFSISNEYYQAQMDSFRKIKSIPQMLDSISALSNNIERIERVFMLDSKCVAVQIREMKTFNIPTSRRLDFWNFNNKNWTQKLSYKENRVDLSKLKDTDTVNQLNYPISLNDPIVLLNSNYFVSITRGTNVSYYGRTKKEISDEEKKFFESNQPGFRVECFDVIKLIK